MIALVALALGPEGPLANSPAVAVLRAAIEREVPAVLPQAERLEHYFALHPLPDALMTQLARITREHSAAHMSKSARDLIGTSPGLPSNVNAAAPPGTVKAGRLRLAHDDDV